MKRVFLSYIVFLESYIINLNQIFRNIILIKEHRNQKKKKKIPKFLILKLLEKYNIVN